MIYKHATKIVVVALIAYVVFFATAAMAHEQPLTNNTSARCPKYEQLLKKYGLPVAVFSPIMYRESRCTPKAIGWNYKEGMSYRDCKLSPAVTYRRCSAVKSFDSGLLQINSSWRTLTATACNSKYGDLSVLLIPDCNMKVAQAIYNNGKGIGNWRATSTAQHK
jgi:hypothetical protein